MLLQMPTAAPASSPRLDVSASGPGLYVTTTGHRLDQGSATESPANTRRQLWYSGSEARQAAAACSLQEETHGKAADDSSGSGSDGNSTTKRSLKRSNLSPPRGKRKSSGSDDIRVEGELVVSELHANDAKPTVRTLGLIFCVLTVKDDGMHLQTVSEHSHHIVDLVVDSMTFLYEQLEQEKTFQLQFRLKSEHQRIQAYSFEVNTREHFDRWVKAIDGYIHKSEQDGSPKKKTERERRRAQAQQVCDPREVVGNFMYSIPPKTKHFILVRHGHYINAHARHVSDDCQVLSQLGRQQARLAGKYLERLYARSPTRHDITIHHSDLTRAVQTAASISKYFGNSELSSSSLLREGWPGRPYSSEHDVLQLPTALQQAAKLENTDTDRMERAYQAFFSSTAEEDDDEDSFQVIVCHANLIRYFLCRALGIDPVGRWGHFEINHCSVTRIDVCASRPLKVISVNETGHLPHSLTTSSEDHL